MHKETHAKKKKALVSSSLFVKKAAVRSCLHDCATTLEKIASYRSHHCSSVVVVQSCVYSSHTRAGRDRASTVKCKKKKKIARAFFSFFINLIVNGCCSELEVCPILRQTPKGSFFFLHLLPAHSSSSCFRFIYIHALLL